jgi:nucleoside-diphosphate-sugar epimerase
MRIVVIGCNGFIGKAISNELNRLGIESIGISKEDFNLLEDATATKLSKVLKQDDQIVFTSSIAPSKSAEDVRNSIKMAETFCKSIESIKIKQVLIISSDSVYGDRTGLFNENSPCNPNSFHGVSQLSREITLQNAKVENLGILRLSAVYGYGDTHNSYGPNRFVNQIQNSETINIFGKGLNSRDHIHIDDVVNLVIRCIKIDFKGVMNLVSGKSYSFKTVAEKCKVAFKSESSIENVGSEGEVIIKNFDNSKIWEFFPDFKSLKLDDALALINDQMQS